MKILGLVLALLTTANVMAEGFSSTVRIEPYSQVNRNTDDGQFTDLEFYLRYTNESEHTFEFRPEFRYSKDDEGITAREHRLRHTFTINKQDDVTFASDFRLLFQGENTAEKSMGELNRLRFGPSVMFTTDAESTNFYFLFKPIMSKRFNRQRYERDTDANTDTPTIDYDIYNLLAAGVSFSKFTVEVGYGYQMKWNSLGDQVDDGYEVYEELAYAASSNLSFVLGHASAADLYDEEGRSNTISLANPDGDIYYGKLVLNF